VAALAEKVDRTERYMYRLENEGKKPSYDVLFALIRELSIPSDLIILAGKANGEFRT
jgi:DNA-binding XRE family transcriptional regulator